MISKFKKIVNTEDKKRLLNNFISIGILQGMNLVFPLITFPYLIRVLGVESYGILGLATAVITFLGVFVDFGFNVTGVRAISVNRNNHQKVIEIYSSIFFIKFILMLFTFILLLFLVLMIDQFRDYWEIYFLSYGLILGQVLFPIWLFQGIEKMKYITYINFITRLIFVLLIFIFIHKKDDLFMIPLFNSLGLIIGAVYAIYFIKKEFNIVYVQQSKKILLNYLHQGKHIFIANLSGNFYGQGQVIILSFFTTELIVGYYTIAQRISSLIIKIFQVLQQTLFPYLARIKENNFNQFKNIMYKTFKITFLVDSLIIFSVLFFAKEIYSLITGHLDIQGLSIFRIWLIIAFFTILNVIIYPFLIALNQDKYMSNIYIFIGLSFILISPILTNIFSVNGMLLSMLSVEFFILVFSIIMIKRGYNENK